MVLPKVVTENIAAQQIMMMLLCSNSYKRSGTENSERNCRGNNPKIFFYFVTE